MTTEINIDYYEEIKGKADMWDELIESFLYGEQEAREEVDKLIQDVNRINYNKLKEKADMWDKKESPLQVAIYFRDDAQDGSRYQVYLCTKCGRMVSKNSNYCHNCGQMLLWEDK